MTKKQENYIIHLYMYKMSNTEEVKEVVSKYVLKPYSI